MLGTLIKHIILNRISSFDQPVVLPSPGPVLLLFEAASNPDDMVLNLGLEGLDIGNLDSSLDPISPSVPPSLTCGSPIRIIS